MTKVKKSSTNYANKKTLAEECPEVYASIEIGRQWTLAICCYLIGGKLRFGELKKRLPDVTDRMLSLELRKLEQRNIVFRRVYPEVPPRVEYELTPIGYELQPIIKELAIWGEKHKDAL